MAKLKNHRKINNQSNFCKEPELTKPVKLCDSKGHLNSASVGWSRHPLHTCNLTGNWLRKKKWNYWLITTNDYLFSVALASMDYMGLAFTYFSEFAAKKFIEQTVIVPFAKGCNLPKTVNGDIIFKHKEINLSFTEDKRGTRIVVDSPAFGGTSLSADFLIEHPEGYETLNVVIPWSKRKFHFTSKQNCLPAEGVVSPGNRNFRFDKGNSYANLDFGRGIWRYSSFWNWASCSGMQNGRIIGLNLGGGWTDGTGMNENAIFVDGRISKLSEDVLFSYNPHNFMKPWTIKTKTSNRINIKFTPFYDRVSKTNLLILKSKIHQMFGYFSGDVITDSEETVHLENIIGIAEEHKALW